MPRDLAQSEEPCPCLSNLQAWDQTHIPCIVKATCVQNRYTTNKNKAHILRTHHKTTKYEMSKQHVSSKSSSPVEMVSNENYPVEPQDTDRQTEDGNLDCGTQQNHPLWFKEKEKLFVV